MLFNGKNFKFNVLLLFIFLLFLIIENEKNIIIDWVLFLFGYD